MAGKYMVRIACILLILSGAVTLILTLIGMGIFDAMQYDSMLISIALFFSFANCIVTIVVGIVGLVKSGNCFEAKYFIVLGLIIGVLQFISILLGGEGVFTLIISVFLVIGGYLMGSSEY